MIGLASVANSQLPLKQLGTSAYDYYVTNSFQAGTSLITLGTFDFPATTSSTVGVWRRGSTRFFHTYGGSNNIFFGINAGNLTMSGGIGSNIGIGLNALTTLTSGEANTATGSNAGQYGTTAQRNTFYGFQAGRNFSTGSFNTAVGNDALYGSSINRTGSYNVAVGGIAMNLINDGDRNVAIGYGAGEDTGTGDNNIYIGYQAGNLNSTGSNNLVIGYDIDVPTSSTSNYMSIGDVIKGNTSTGQISLPTVPATDNTVTQLLGRTTAGDIVVRDFGIVGTPVHLTGKTAAILATTLYAVTTNGFYSVTVQLAVTGTGGTSIGAQVKFTNVADNVVKTMPTNNTNGLNQCTSSSTTNAISYTVIVYAKAGTNIEYLVNLAGSGQTYSVDAFVQKL